MIQNINTHAVRPEIYSVVPDVPGFTTSGITPEVENYFATFEMEVDYFAAVEPAVKKAIGKDGEQDPDLCPEGVCAYEPVTSSGKYGGDKISFDSNGKQIPKGSYNPQIGNTYNEQVFNEGSKISPNPTYLGTDGKQHNASVPQSTQGKLQHHYRNGVDQNQAEVSTHPLGTFNYYGTDIPSSAKTPGIKPFRSKLIK